jgi:hypothetical protein
MASRSTRRAPDSRPRGRFPGVCRTVRPNGVVCFQAFLTVQGQRHSLGRWRTDQQAALAVDRAALHFGLDERPLNLPRQSRRAGAASPEELRAFADQMNRAEVGGTSGYCGVSRAGAKFAAIFCRGNQRRHLGTFWTAREAALAHDRAVLFFGSRHRLNLPEQSRQLGPASPELIRRTPNQAAEPHGVTATAAVFVAWIELKGRRAYLGTWPSRRQAALAHDRAALFHGFPQEVLNFPGQARRLGPASADALRAQAMRRMKKTSGYLGVSRDTGHRWVTSVRRKDGSAAYLGVFAREQDAALARDRVELGVSGSDAVLNLPERRLEPWSVAKARAWARSLAEPDKHARRASPRRRR